MTTDPLRSAAAGIALIAMGGERHGHILRANQALAALLASSPDALVGTRICDHVHPQDRARVDEAFLALMADADRLHEGDVRLIASDGGSVAVRAVASVIARRGGRAVVLRVLAAPSRRA